jgi:phenylalanyl-tRNA synthetase beta chain
MNFKTELPDINTIAKELPMESYKNQVRDFLAGNGFIEVINWHITSENVLFNKMNAKERRIVKLLNPKTSDYTVMRDYLTPLIINLYSQNKHNDYPQNIFEVGEVMNLDPIESSGVSEGVNLCFATAHSTSNYSEVKGVLDNLMKMLGIKYSIKIVNNSSFIDGRVAEIIVNKKPIGFIGEVSPEVLVNFDLKIPITICEISLSKIL